MNIAIWIAVALVCIAFPATALSAGGAKTPKGEPLEKYAAVTGLPITDQVALPVAERIRRRQRGMQIGAVAGIVIAAIVAILLLDNDSWVGVLVMLAAAVGSGFGGAWVLATNRPAPNPKHAVVARLRSVQLSDYLTAPERFGHRIAPVAALLGTIAGSVLLMQLPASARGSNIIIGLVAAVLSLVFWLVTTFALRWVLEAPARSETELELAWDDVERAEVLRQVVNLSTIVVSLSLLTWVVMVGNSLTMHGYYREHPGQSYLLTGVTLAVFGLLFVLQAGGPLWAWISGERKGYELRQLWPGGVRLS